ncbi:MAG TPA: hypothetical protein VHW60_06810 [Caulobacteraceae bacterium]|jgi:hypothetical protein|nr:hypothetical protein [Caulobacteraceae bacterium]
MARFAILAISVAGGLALVACKPPAPPPPDPEADPIARSFYEEVRTGADLDADVHLAHELKNPTTEEELAQFRTLIPADPPSSIELTSAETHTDSTGTLTKLTEVYHYVDRNLLAQTALFKSPAGVDPIIVGFKLTQQDAGG